MTDPRGEALQPLTAQMIEDFRAMNMEEADAAKHKYPEGVAAEVKRRVNMICDAALLSAFQTPSNSTLELLATEIERQSRSGEVALDDEEWAAVTASLRSATAPLSDNYIQNVPDKCDRIIWRGNYYHLPDTKTPLPATARSEPVAWVDERAPKALERGDMPFVHAYRKPPYAKSVPLYAAPLSEKPAIPEGWKLVPVEPTERQIRVIQEHLKKTKQMSVPEALAGLIARSMLAAAPSPDGNEEKGV
jgi:hypothetical protein